MLINSLKLRYCSSSKSGDYAQRVKFINLFFLSSLVLSCNPLKRDSRNEFAIVVYEFNNINSKDYCLFNKYIFIGNNSYLLKENLKIKPIKPYSNKFNDSTYNIDFTKELNIHEKGILKIIGNNNFFKAKYFPDKIFICFKLKGTFLIKKTKDNSLSSSSFYDLLLNEFNFKKDEVLILKKIYNTEKIDSVTFGKMIFHKTNRKSIPLISCSMNSDEIL